MENTDYKLPTRRDVYFLLHFLTAALAGQLLGNALQFWSAYSNYGALIVKQSMYQALTLGIVGLLISLSFCKSGRRSFAVLTLIAGFFYGYEVSRYQVEMVMNSTDIFAGYTIVAALIGINLFDKSNQFRLYSSILVFFVISAYGGFIGVQNINWQNELRGNSSLACNPCVRNAHPESVKTEEKN